MCYFSPAFPPSLSHSASFHLGGTHGELKYTPPEMFSPLCEAAEQEKKVHGDLSLYPSFSLLSSIASPSLTPPPSPPHIQGIYLDPFEQLGCPKAQILCGPKIVSGQVSFTAIPIDTSQVCGDCTCSQLSLSLVINSLSFSLSPML